MEGIERTNAVVVRGVGQRQGTGIPPRWDPFAIEVNRGRNCYACGDSGIWPTIVGIEEEGGRWMEGE